MSYNFPEAHFSSEQKHNSTYTLPAYSLIFLFQIQKGKVHGSIDVGLSVMSIKKKARRIDLDTEEHIYHLKVKLFSASGISRGCDLPAPVADWRRFPQLSFFAPRSRWNPRTGLMLGSPNCAITACTVRMKSCDHQGMQVSTYSLQLQQLSLPQLLTFLLWMERYNLVL